MTNTMAKKRNRWIYLFFVFFIVACIGLVFTLFQDTDYTIKNKSKKDYHTIHYQKKEYSYNTSNINILFMGIDNTDNTNTQADSLQLYSLNRKKKTISVLSLNRDAMTSIELFDATHRSLGYKKQHLALAYAYGKNPENGSKLESKAVSKMLYNIPITKYVSMDMGQLSSLQEIVGNLELVCPNDSVSSVNPDWKQGNTIEITPDTVESFIRSRDTDVAFSNETRMERQQAYIDAYYASLKSMLDTEFEDTVRRLYTFVEKVNTNISLTELENYARMLISYKYDSNKDFYTLPGKDVEGSLHDEFCIDKKTLKKLVVDLYYEGEG